MANFQTHLTVATVTSALAGSTAISLQLVSQTEVIALWALGALGGLLPDIDSDDSTSLKLVFNVLAMIGALFVVMWFYPLLSIVGLWIVGALVFSFIRYVWVPVFERFTVHRGSLHSLLAGILFSVCSVHLSLIFGMDSVFSWCAGIFILIGVLTHLTLDELYSVDLSNLEVKRSFGSALKPASLAYPIPTVLQVVLCAGLIYLLPSPKPLVMALEQARFEFLPVAEWASIKRFIGV